MGVSARYILAAAALALAPATASANCTTCTPGGMVTPPTVTGPSPTISNPNFQGGGNPGRPANGCGSMCAPGVPTGPNIVVPTPYVPAPNITVVNPGGGHHHGATTVIHNTTLVDNSHYEFRSVAVAGGGAVASVGVAGGGFAMASQEARRETRTVERIAAIQAFCVDDRGVPHPASQTFGEQEVSAGFEGEIFRCIAGTHMRVTLGRYENGAASFENGASFDCEKGQALVYRNGEVVCRTQEPRRQCNERSLLRRYGPGIKLVRVQVTETVEVAETRETTTFQAASFGGGVGDGW